MRKHIAAVTALTLLTPLTQVALPVAAADDLASRFTLGVMPGTHFGAHLDDLADQPRDRESWSIARRAMACARSRT
mgnify:CR=1 FL=1